jgi:hypothetical protein
MNRALSEILKETLEPEKFRSSIIELNGDFDFSLESMIGMGEVYCALYPDSVTHTDSAQVQIGYRLVRISIAEVLLKGLDDRLKVPYREMFTSVRSIPRNMTKVVEITGMDEAQRINAEIDIKIKKIKDDIDLMPNSVIKERYIGGISVFYNVIYLIKKSVSCGITGGVL